MRTTIHWMAFLVMITVAQSRAEPFAVNLFSFMPGGASSKATYSIRGIIGQPGAQMMAGGGFGVAGGFWGSIAILQQPGFPSLSIARAGTNAVIFWAADFVGFTLQRKQSNLNTTESWTDAGLPVVTVNGTNTVTVPLSGYAVYRLKR